jgi:hypothetical protein
MVVNGCHCLVVACLDGTGKGQQTGQLRLREGLPRCSMVLLSPAGRVIDVGDHFAPEAPTMNPQPLPALSSGDPSAWDGAV